VDACPGEFSFSPIDFGVKFFKPWVSQNGLFLAKICDEELGSFLLVSAFDVEVDTVLDEPCLILGSVYIEYLPFLG